MTITPRVIDLYHGDDVSSFDSIYAAEFRGVIHKATEGATLTDPLYADRRTQALDAGLLWGAYHFLRPGDMQDQASRFIDVAKPSEATLLAVDHEDTKVSLADLVTFMKEAESLVGRKLVLYSGFLIKEQMPSAVKSINSSGKYLSSHRLWLAQYAAAPKLPSGWAAAWLWQYSDTGKVDGIEGNADLNSFSGTDDELALEWSGS